MAEGMVRLPPTGYHAWASVAWLVDRHPRLRDLAARLPGVIDADGVNPHELARAIDDDVPQFAAMSSGEKRLLRTLATFGARNGVGWLVDDTIGLDDDGRAFVEDWAAAVLAYGRTT